MKAIILMTILFLLSGLSTVIAKKFQQCTSETVLDFTWYNVVNSIIACIYFAVSSGFSLSSKHPRSALHYIIENVAEDILQVAEFLLSTPLTTISVTTKYPTSTTQEFP